MIETVGKPLDRVDGRAKVMGNARFAAEFKEKNVAHAVMVPSSIAAGTLRSIDTAAAEKSPGVIAVLTHRNFPKLTKIATFATGGAAGENRMPFEGTTIHYAGQHIAAVVAETFEQATAAAMLVKASYTRQAPRSSLERHRGEAIPKAMWGPPETKRGDADGAFASAAVKVDQTYRTPIQHHNMMEPHALVASWDADRLTVHDSTQYIFGTRAALAKAFSVPEENVRVLSPFVGGGFGCKGEVWPHVLVTVAAARQLQRPVKTVLTRKQLYTSNGHRSDTIQRVALGAARDGKLTSIIHESTAHTSMFDTFVEPCTVTTKMMYATPNLRAITRVVSLNQGTPTFMRAPGETPGMFALESALDELAYELGIDPVELRIINHADTDPETGKPWSSKSLKECYRQAADRFGWSQRKPQPRSMRDGRELIGWGMASASYPSYQFPASARVRLLADGTALVQSGGQEMGMGTATAQTQLAASLLGLPVERVRFELGDSNLPNAPVAGGSAQTASIGAAVKGAVDAVFKKLAALANPGETPAATLTRHGIPSIEASYDFKPGESNKSSHAFGAHFVEVAVDSDIGLVRVRRVVSAFAAGRIINAKTVRSQYLGGIVQGIGMALMEQTHIDENLGRYTNANIAEYLVPVNADIVSIEPIMVDEVDETVNSIGVKGVGEIPIVGVAGAVANAVYHATGRRIRDLPITIEKMI